jgi:predicted TIM-barrel fold metal-dependent hydrolase
MAQYKMISADSHVSEPPDLWAERVDKRFRDRAPQIVVDPPGLTGAYFMAEGVKPHPIGIGIAAGKSAQEITKILKNSTYADARRGGWDPVERLKDNELDGVEADVLYTTLGFRIFWIRDAALQVECFRVYNDWIAELCRHAPKRMAGLALISLYDPKQGAAELERCAKMGLKGAMIWASPPESQPYSSDIYDPFWSAAQALNMPVSLHSITGMGRESQWDFKPGNRHMAFTVLVHEVEQSFSVLIFSGVLERFPKLKIVSAENNCGWLPYYLQRMDHTYERFAKVEGAKMSMKPSEYFRRQMYCTYIDDAVGVANRHAVGVENLMWSSDYPHTSSSWPYSQDVVARDFPGGVSAEDRYKMTRGNAARLYGLLE